MRRYQREAMTDVLVSNVTVSERQFADVIRGGFVRHAR